MTSTIAAQIEDEGEVFDAVIYSITAGRWRERPDEDGLIGRGGADSRFPRSPFVKREPVLRAVDLRFERCFVPSLPER